MNAALRQFLEDFASIHKLTIPSNIIEIVEDDLARGKLKEPDPFEFARDAGQYIFGSIDKESLEGHEDVLERAEKNGIDQEEILELWSDELGEAANEILDWGFCLDWAVNRLRLERTPDVER